MGNISVHGLAAKSLKIVLCAVLAFAMVPFAGLQNGDRAYASESTDSKIVDVNDTIGNGDSDFAAPDITKSEITEGKIEGIPSDDANGDEIRALDDYSMMLGYVYYEKDLYYSGSVQHPTIIVTNAYDVRVPSSAYSVAYSNPNSKDPGIYSFTVTGINGYVGTYTSTYTINKQYIASAKLSYTVSGYTGKAKPPKVTVYAYVGNPLNNKTKVIAKSITASTKDVKITYRNSSGKAISKSSVKKVGRYSVYIQGQGGYTNSGTFEFGIFPAKTSISKITGSKAGFTVKWKASKGNNIKGYQVRYSTSSSMKNSKVLTIRKSSARSKAVGVLTGNKKYYVQVRAYSTIGSYKFSGDWSAKKTVKTKKGKSSLALNTSSLAKQVTSYTNKYRKQVGAKNLKLDSKLTNAAQARAVEMADSGIFSHTRPDGTSCFTISDAINANTGGDIYAENIAYGQPNAKSVSTAWRNSSGHYANMVNKSYTKIGVGMAKDSRGRIYWVQLFA